ncbi:MAG: VOC family protein [Candidatus Eremiobacteraeota bacterium]|nr:VOC family protein [Candidatus Eremiobacteraeota bacterium]
MQLAPYLNLGGRCEEALNFYRDCLGGSISELHRFEGSPAEAQVGAGQKDKIMHATFTFDGGTFMASDGPGDAAVTESNIALSLGLDDAKRGEEIFNALSAGGQVQMPFQKQFWGATFGMFNDRYGIQWMVNCGG